MVVVAQLVRASVCGTEGRGFESRHPPQVFQIRVDILIYSTLRQNSNLLSLFEKLYTGVTKLIVQM